MVEGLKEALYEDNEQRKEISMLKKLDQSENIKRSKNFYVRYVIWLLNYD